MQTEPSTPTQPVLNPFLQKHQKDVMGIIHGFDRLRFQGSLRYLYRVPIFEEYLAQAKVLWKDYKVYATKLTARVCQAAEQLAQTAKRPFAYIASARASKEELARQVAQRDGIREGLIGVFRCVEPCRTYHARGNYATKKLELRLEWGKCLHLYFYVQHPRLGLLHLRLQTWFPFLIHICWNGHEWLARQMDEQKLAYRRADNRFTWIKDFPAAQALADAQLKTDWAAQCEELRRTYHPLHEEIAKPLPLSYYWTAPQTEYASDVLFHEQATLERLFPRLVHHAMLHLSSEQVMRFLGKRCNGCFEGQVTSDLRRRSEGMRVKHWVNHNSIKLYNCLNVLRPETTIHEAEDLRIYRAPETQPNKGRLAWYPLRRGVADLYRRAQLSRAANERYLTAIAAASDATTLAEEAVQVCRAIRRDGQPYRALNPFNPADAQLLEVVSRGDWLIKGFRNRDLRPLLHGQAKSKEDQRRQAGKVTRRLALLHAHGLIAKVSRTHRWLVTAKGRRILTALLAARRANTEQLISFAA